MRAAFPLRTLVACALLSLAGTAALAQPATILDAKDASANTRLRVDANGGILAQGEYNSGATNGLHVEGAGTRMMWYPGKAAFRTGGINGTQWDDANIGLYSVAMGQNVRASGTNAIALGYESVANGIRSVAIGEGHIASGYASIALGFYAYTRTSGGTLRNGTFVFGDYSTKDFPMSGTGTCETRCVYAALENAAYWRVANGFYIYTSSAGSAGTGVQVGAGGTSWSTISDSTRKERHRPYDAAAVLAGLSRLRLGTWNYKGQDAATMRHWGPMAQDFHREFGRDGVGVIGNDTTISTQDADGVLFAAAQALEAKTRAQQAEIDALRARLDALERRSAPTTAGLPLALGLVLAGAAAGFALRRLAPVGPSGRGA